MLSVKLLDDYIIKSQDIKTFKIQLLRDGKPHAIPADCSVTLLIATTKTIVKEETMKIVDAGEGIVEFTLHATIGVGSFDCEFILSNNDDINLTFPDNGFTVLKISPCLSERPIEEVAPSEYARLNERMDGFILELDTFESEVELLLAGYEEEFEDMQNEFNADIAALNTANQTFKNEMIANVGTYEDRIAHIENSVTATETLIDKVNALPDNAGNFVEVTKVQGNTLQNLCVNERTYSPQYCQMSYDSTGTYATVASLDSTSKGNMVMTFDSNLLKPNTKYTMIFREIYHVSNRILLRDVDSATNLPLNLVENNMCTFTTLATTSNYYRIYYYSLEVGEKVRIKDNVIVLEGDWTNRTDIPDFFTGIQSVDSVQVKSISKNLFTFDGRTENSFTKFAKEEKRALTGNGIYCGFTSNNFSSPNNTKYVITGSNSANVYTTQVGYNLAVDFEIIPNKTYVVRVDNGVSTALAWYSEDGTYLGFTDNRKATMPYNAKYLVVHLKPANSKVYVEYNNIQLEMADTASEFSEHGETIMQIPLAEPLRSLPNGVCDEITANKITRYIGKEVIDGNTSLGSPTLLTSVYRTRVLFDKGTSGLGKSISDSLVNIWNYSEDVEHYYLDEESIWLFISKDKFDGTTNGLRAYLAEHPIKIYYTLKNPITEELIIPNDAILQTYQNGHILLENTPVRPKVDVQYAIGLQGKILKLETEIAEAEDLLDNIFTANDVEDYWGGN